MSSIIKSLCCITGDNTVNQLYFKKNKLTKSTTTTKKKKKEEKWRLIQDKGNKEL